MQYWKGFACGLLLAAALEAQPQPPAIPPVVAVKTPTGMPPRAAATEYSGHEQAGDLTIAADFLGHSLPTGSGLLKSEDYVAVEVAVFGPAGAHVDVAHSQFTLRINGKKALESQPFEYLASTIKDPDWAPPEAEKSKTSVGGLSAGNDPNSGPPPPPRIPPEVKRANEQKVRKTIMLEGDRALPIAGMLFFRYGGQEKGIHQVELIYNGPNGKAKLELQ